MKIRKILYIGLCLTIGTLIRVNGQNNISETNARLEKQTSEIIAKRSSPNKLLTNEIAVIKIDKANEHLNRMLNEQLALQALMFPADELYLSNWDTVHVNPFQNQTIDFPDSCSIDCSSFMMPVVLDKIKITSKYGVRRRQMHHGTDIDLNNGDTIRAAFDGKVRIKSFERKGYGNYIVLRHPNGLETVYGHLSKFLIRENQVVHAGEPIGLGGNTGRSTGTHLHFETRFLGKDIDPEEIIDFENGTPHRDYYVFINIKINGKKSNLYATSPNAIAVHRVQKGETLSVIARKYGTTVDELCLLNGISRTSTLSIGQAIQLRAKQIKVEATTDALRKASSEQQATAPKPTFSSNASVSRPAASDKKIEATIQLTSEEINGTIYHTIQSGDSLFSIAKKYGTTIQKLCELNQIEENMILRPGKKLRCS